MKRKKADGILIKWKERANRMIQVQWEIKIAFIRGKWPTVGRPVGRCKYLTFQIPRTRRMTSYTSFRTVTKILSLISLNKSPRPFSAIRWHSSALSLSFIKNLSPIKANIMCIYNYIYTGLFFKWSAIIEKINTQVIKILREEKYFRETPMFAFIDWLIKHCFTFHCKSKLLYIYILYFVRKTTQKVENILLLKWCFNKSN